MTILTAEFPVPCNPEDLLRPPHLRGAPLPSRELSVYVIGEVDDGPVKIGYAADAWKRLGELQIGNPRELCLYFAQPRVDARLVEAASHRELGARRLRGEWFDVDPGTAVCTLNLILHTASHFGLSPVLASASLRIVDGVIERLCSACGKWLPAGAYHRSPSNAAGLQARCKRCGKDMVRDKMSADDEARKRRNETSRRGQSRRRAAARGGREPQPFRFTPGGPNPRAKLTISQREELRARRLNHESAAVLAAEFSVTESYVRALAPGVDLRRKRADV